MNAFLKSDEFDAGLSALKDQVGKAIIAKHYPRGVNHDPFHTV